MNGSVDLLRSPAPGRSTLTISAPKSPSTWVAHGPSWTCVRSTTRMPASGRVPVISEVLELAIAHGHEEERLGAPAVVVGRRELDRAGGVALDGADLLHRVAHLRARRRPALQGLDDRRRRIGTEDGAEAVDAAVVLHQREQLLQ